MNTANIEAKEIFSPPLLQRLAVKTVVIFRALQLGDMLCAVPALRALRAALPAAKITLAGLPWAEQFVSRYHHYVDDFIAFPGHPAFPEQPVQESRIVDFYGAIRARKIDLCLQMHGSGQISNQIVQAFGAKLIAGFCPQGDQPNMPANFMPYPDTGAEPVRLLKFIEFLGAPAIGTHLEFPLTEQDRHELDESGLAMDLAPGSYVCLHPGARSRDKCWPPHLFAEVADRLADEFGVSIVLTGSAKEKDLTSAVASHMRHRAIDTASPISIGAMAALMNRARLLICNDTGVSHIAAGLRLPSVVIFSKADIHRWSPLDRNLHRCLWDPDGEKVSIVLEQARALLAATPNVKVH